MIINHLMLGYQVFRQTNKKHTLHVWYITSIWHMLVVNVGLNVGNYSSTMEHREVS